MNVIIQPGALSGTLQVPGSKSHTIRSVLLATLAEGTSILKNPLASGDGLSALEAARCFGAKIEQQDDLWIITGRGGDLQVPVNVIDTKNSGTTTSFFTSVAALVDGYTVITGDEQIRRRPIKNLVNAINALGATAFLTRQDSECPPLVVRGKLMGGSVSLVGRNSQHISSLLVSCALAEGRTEIHVIDAREKPYVQMTLDWMRKFGVEVENPENYTHFIIEGGHRYKAGEFSIASDWSAVAFPLVGAAITDSDLLLPGLDFGDSQGDKRVVEILRQFGAQIEMVGSDALRVIGGATLKSDFAIDLSDIPDSLPALSVLATQAEGTTRFVNLEHVRQKETDRVQEMCDKLGTLGADIHIQDDVLVVHGPTPLRGGTVDSSNDHRIAMALAVAGLAAEQAIEVTNADCAAVSFPLFFEKFAACGAKIVFT